MAKDPRLYVLNEKVPSDDVLVSMLNVLFSQTKMSSVEKKENLSENYGLDMDRDLGKEIDDNSRAQTSDRQSRSGSGNR